MFDYIALYWNGPTPALVEELTHRLQLAPEWSVVADEANLKIYVTRDPHGVAQAHSLAAGGGAILGTVFARNGSDPIERLTNDSERVAGLRRSLGADLTRHYWGSYVGFVRSADETGLTVLRSPLGRLPCLWATRAGVHLFVSSLACYRSLHRSHALSLNWQFLAARMVNVANLDATGVNELIALRAGECVRLSRARCERQLYWDPLQVATTEPIRRTDVAIDCLRETTQQVVRAWASKHERLLCYVSGGLDSSIVVACAHPHHAPMAGIHFYTPEEMEEDERLYARAVANRVGLPLREFERDPHIDLSEMLKARLTAEPMSYSDALELRSPTNGLAREFGATGVLTGARGDELLGHSYALLSVADYIYDQPFGPRLPATVMSAARLETRSVWNVLRSTARLGIGKHRWSVKRNTQAYVSLLNWEPVNDLLRALPAAAPWFDRGNYVPPGKQFQIFSLLNPGSHGMPFDAPGTPDEIVPLMSQPLVELCLRIPTYVLMHGGWDRAVARRAFEADLPREIFLRRSKGGQEKHALRLLKHNFDFARELLIDGWLVRSELVHRQRLEEAFAQHPSSVLRGMAEIYQCLNIEVWLRLMERDGISMTADRAASATTLAHAAP